MRSQVPARLCPAFLTLIPLAAAGGCHRADNLSAHSRAVEESPRIEPGPPKAPPGVVRHEPWDHGPPARWFPAAARTPNTPEVTGRWNAVEPKEAPAPSTATAAPPPSPDPAYLAKQRRYFDEWARLAPSWAGLPPAERESKRAALKSSIIPDTGEVTP